ncbi:MAG: Stk1 family PASTA domain-containing Ser/Thr kinase [Nocardioides sp.]
MLTQRRARSAAKARSQDPMVGKVIDKRYRIVRKIASGGMATVYEAVDQRLQRTVALKVMHPGLGDPREYAARFEREARAAAKLAHANVVGVFDFGNDRGTVYLAMELVPGKTTLRDLVTAEAPMPPQRALSLLEPIVIALASAHKAGIVHRDMKPENVLIAPSGAVKVADFGLARAISSTTQHTRTGMLIGTVSYVAPELVEHGICDARADVYATGVIAFELLTGRKPHEGSNPIQVAYSHVNTDIAAPSTVVATLPAIVDDLVLAMTARDPRFRPADAIDLLDQLRRVQRALAAGGDAAAAPAAAAIGSVARSSSVVPEAIDPLADTTSRPAVRPTTAISLDTAKRASHPIAVTAKRRRRWRGPVSLLLALTLTGGLGAGAWWFGYGRYDTVPGVLNLQASAASQRLQDAGFEVAVEREFTPSDADKGLVIASDPGPGDQLLPGDTVTLTVSRGVEDYELRSMAGWVLDRAQDYLTSIKMTQSDVTEVWSETVETGQVVRQDPSAGVRLRPGAVVNLWVSKGRQPINFADFTGRSADQAEDVLDGKGLEVVRTEEFSETVPDGTVISMSPTSGPLYRGDSVSLLVSKGPELFEVPSVRGESLESAEEKLTEAGFAVVVEQHSLYVGWNRVISEDNAGQMLPKGSTVTIHIV